MINADFISGKKHIYLCVDGHAQSGEVGKDLVCCAVSSLTYSLAQYLTAAHKQKKLKKAPEIDLSKGHAYIRCKPKKEYYGNVSEAFFCIMSGMVLIESENPDCIHVFSDGKKII